MNSTETGNRTYDTSDLTLASFLRCRSFTIDDIRRQNGKTVFVFVDSSQLRNAILEAIYRDDHAAVE